ncbi:MAG: transporter substrate-binding protein, partial [Verrucomicrobiales bacterium]
SLPAKDLVGHLGCWTYFMTIDSPANKKFIANFNSWLGKTKVPGIIKKDRVTCSPMVLSYNGVYLWKAAVEKAKSFDPEKVMKALESGISFDGPGGKVTTQKNHHLTKTVYIGETLENGQFAISETIKDVFGEPFLKGTFKKK